MLYLTSGSVPELKPLSSFERLKVTVAAERTFEGTPQSKRIKWVWLTACVYVPLAAFFVAQDIPGLGSSVTYLIFFLCLIVGAAACQHFRMRYLRPHMRDYLAKIRVAPDTWPNQIQDIYQLHRDLLPPKAGRNPLLLLLLLLGVFVLVYNLLTLAPEIPWFARLAVCILVPLLAQAVIDRVARHFQRSAHS